MLSAQYWDTGFPNLPQTLSVLISFIVSISQSIKKYANDENYLRNVFKHVWIKILTPIKASKS